MSKGLLAPVAVLLACCSTAFGQSTGPVTLGPVSASSTSASPSNTAIMPAPTTVVGNCDGCHLDGVDCAHPCGDCSQTWFIGEYLLWWTKGSPNPTPLATSVIPGTPTGTLPPRGAIGGPGTSVLIGNETIDLGAQGGGRFTAGHWFDKDQCFGLEGSFFFLEQVSETQTAKSSGGAGSPILFIPYTDVTGTFTGGVPGHSALLSDLGQLFAIPGGLNGPFISHDVLTLSSQTLGAELNGVFTLARNGRMHLTGLAGFRYFYLNEELDFTSDNQTVPAAQTAVTYNTFDMFHATNNFYGGQIGLRLEYGPDDGHGGNLGGVCFRGDVKLALGDTNESVHINGSTDTNLGNPLLPSATSFVGGAFTQLSNIGGYDSNHFAVIPEVNLNVGYAVTTCVKLFLGYDFLYVSDVARPGDQIDPGINLYRTGPALASGIAPPATNPARPAFNVTESSFWAQGLNVGVDVRF